MTDDRKFAVALKAQVDGLIANVDLFSEQAGTLNEIIDAQTGDSVQAHVTRVGIGNVPGALQSLAQAQRRTACLAAAMSRLVKLIAIEHPIE